MGRGRKADPHVQERVRVIADMMAAGVYVTRDTPRMLAPKWGCSVKTVERYATRAAKRVRASIGNDERLKTEMLAYLKRVTSICIKRGTETHASELPDGTPNPNAGELKERNAYQWLNTGIQAIDRIASLTGIDMPKRFELNTKYSLDDIAALQASVERNKCPSENETSGPSYSPQRLLISGPSAGSSKSSRKEE